MSRRKTPDAKLVALLGDQERLITRTAKAYSRLKRAFTGYDKIRRALARNIKQVKDREAELYAERASQRVSKEVNGE